MLQFCKDFTKKFTVTKGETLAYIHDPFQVNPPQKVKAPFNGIVIGLTNLPVVNEGDAVFNIASTTRLKMLDAYIDDMRDEITQFDS